MYLAESKLKKTDLYKKRILEKNYMVKMFLDREVFGDVEKEVNLKRNEKKGTVVLDKLKNMIKIFNRIAERVTKGNEYTVILNLGISETTADYFYQYKKLLDYARERGRYNEVHNELKRQELNVLFSAIKYPKKDTFTSFNIEKLEKVLPQIIGTPLAVLLTMKMRSSIPSGVSGITGLSDTKIAELLSINRSTVYRARDLLAKLGLITVLSKKKENIAGNIFTYSKYRINV